MWGGPWTVGTVSARAPADTGLLATTINTLTAKGTDQRTPQGVGNLQLVSPFLVRGLDDDTGDPIYYRAGVAVMSLRFVPEPAAVLQLVSGLTGLAVMYRFFRWKRRNGRPAPR